MRRDVAIIHSYWNVGKTINYIRFDVELPNDFYFLIVVEPTLQPTGVVPLNRWLRTTRLIGIKEIDIRLIPATMDQEEIAFLFRHCGLVSAPVVDEHSRLIGVIDMDDVVHVIDEEAKVDLLKLAGVREDDVCDAIVDTILSRFSCLLVNLMTAIHASPVIGLFDAAIDKGMALAV